MWKPRFDAAVAAWRELQSRSVAAGLCDATIVAVDSYALNACAATWETLGLAWIPLEAALRLDAASGPDAAPVALLIALVRKRDHDAFVQAYKGGPPGELQRWLGAPACCVAAAARASRHGVTDPMWRMALAARASDRPARRLIACDCLPACNILLRGVGVRAIAHAPCRFDCAATIDLAARLQALGDPRSEAFAFVTAILGWPMQWSAWHGLAEIRTPVCKIVSASDYSSYRYEVRLRGSEWPREGAKGLDFPYRDASVRRLTNASGFRRGLTMSGRSDAGS